MIAFKKYSAVIFILGLQFEKAATYVAQLKWAKKLTSFSSFPNLSTVLATRGRGKPMPLSIIAKFLSCGGSLVVRSGSHDLGGLISRLFLRVAAANFAAIVPPDISGGDRGAGDMGGSGRGELNFRTLTPC